MLNHILQINDSEALINSLKNGSIVLNNNHCKDNTLNKTIRILFNKHWCWFDLIFFEILFDHGAQIAQKGNSNTLMMIISHGEWYIKKFGENARKNVIDLLKMMIYRGAESPDIDILTHCMRFNDIELIRIISKINNLQKKSDALYYAIQHKNQQLVKICRDLEIYPDTASGCTNSLTQAVIYGDEEIVKIIIEYGGIPDTSQTSTNTLSNAVIRGNKKIVKMILNNGGIPDSSQTHSNTLTQMMKLGMGKQNIDIVELMINVGGKPNISHGCIDNTLTSAVVHGSVEMIDIILKNGGKPDTSQTSSNTLSHAVLRGDPQIVESICQYGGQSVVSDWTSNDCFFPHEPIPQLNTMTICAMQCNIEIMKILCQNKNAIPDSSCNIGNTMTQALIRSKKELNDVKSEKMSRGIIDRTKQIVDLIHKCGGKPHIGNEKSNTLSCAISLNDIQLIEQIMNYQEHTFINFTILNRAISTKNIDIINAICNHNAGVDLNNYDSDTNTLYLATMTLDPQIVSTIIMQGAKPPFICKTYSATNTIFALMYYQFKNNNENFDENKFCTLINLLLCSGATIHNKSHDKNYERIINDYRTFLEGSVSNKSKLSVKKIKEMLIEQMEILTSNNLPKKQFISEFNHILPVPCVGIIYDYVLIKSKVDFIDWSKY